MCFLLLVKCCLLMVRPSTLLTADTWPSARANPPLGRRCWGAGVLGKPWWLSLGGDRARNDEELLRVVVTPFSQREAGDKSYLSVWLQDRKDGRTHS